MPPTWAKRVEMRKPSVANRGRWRGGAKDSMQCTWPRPPLWHTTLPLSQVPFSPEEQAAVQAALGKRPEGEQMPKCVGAINTPLYPTQDAGAGTVSNWDYCTCVHSSDMAETHLKEKYIVQLRLVCVYWKCVVMAKIQLFIQSGIISFTLLLPKFR